MSIGFAAVDYIHNNIMYYARARARVMVQWALSILRGPARRRLEIAIMRRDYHTVVVRAAVEAAAVITSDCTARRRVSASVDWAPFIFHLLARGLPVVKNINFTRATYV